MEKIEKTDLKSFRNDEHFQFCTDFIGLINSVGATKLKVQKQFDAFVPLYRQEDEALKKILKSALTEKIAEADRERDTVFRGMAEANRAALNHFSPTVREAAQRLQIVFDTYGNLTRKAVAEETSAMYNLLRELMHNHEADIRLTGLDAWAEELYTRNQTVQKLMEDRYDETASRTDLVLKEVRTRVDEAYRTITERIDALYLVEGDEIEVDPDKNDGTVAIPTPYADFIRRLNAIIERANNLLARRRSGKKEDEPETPEETETTAGTTE